MNRKNQLRARRARSHRRQFTFFCIILAVVLLGGVLLFSPLLNGKNRQATPTHDSASSVSKVKKEPSQTSREKQKVQDKTNNKELTWEKQESPVQLPILMYHAIHIMDPSETANANLIVAPDVFESHLKALKEAGYYTVTPEEAYKILTENVLPQGKKQVIWLTFDDGNADFYSQAFPLLQKYKMKATNNIITGYAQAGTGLTPDQIKEMAKDGMTFQGHTVNHPDLSVSSTTSQTSELTDSKTYLDKLLAQDTISLAYPAGRYTADTIAAAQAAGYKLATTTKQGLASLEDGLLSLDRIRIMPTTTAQDLLNEISY